MAIGKYDALKIEPKILKFWKDSNIYDKVKKKASKGKDYYFLDGPPYTSGKVHIGTAWNKSLKDCFLRFKRMNNVNIWDRAGYDMHGLPTAHAVMKKLKIKHKDDIPKYGVDKFIKECIKLSKDNMKEMNKDFSRLGVWMDFEGAYQSIDPKFIDGEWWLIKKAHENKRLYEGEKVMHWCSNCGTALAKHELEYKNVKDDSIFLKFKIKDKKDEYLIIWTTTPWTIPYNLGVMVNPEEEYVKAKVGNETWVVAAKLAGVFIQGVAEKKYEVMETVKGKDLEGLEYEHPLYGELKDVYDKLKKESPKVHTVVLSKEYVDVGSGSGLVHTAPGCGPEDYEVGHEYGIPPFNNLNENGVFPKEMGKYSGFTAKKDDKKFIEEFKKKGALIASTPVEHEYAHCWRCHKPVIFRTTKQWFFKIEDLKEKMREMNKKVKWEPDWAGSRQFDDWLDNLRDNSITRQRYWGCPVPIWRCDKCDNYTVIGSAKELKEKGGKIPDDLHIPWIDDVEIKCNKCDAMMKRVPDILDVWVDAGTNSWTCLNYPAEKDKFKKLFPADFILEGKDQIRGWFNLLFVNSMVAMNKHSYKSVYMHGFVNDAQGRKMSKSKGNYILPEEVIEKHGADTFRYYTIGGTNPGEDLNYNFEDIELKEKNLMVLWNLHKLLVDLSKEAGNPAEFDEILMKDVLDIEERYILSKLNNTIFKVTELYKEHKLNEVPSVIEELFLELSRTYVQLVREKSSVGSEEDKKLVAFTLYKVLIEGLKMFSTISPFITEEIYQNLKKEFKLKKESIHLFDWPKAEKKMINKKLEKNMEIAGDVIQGILYAREKIERGLRWPVKEANVVSKDKDVIKAVEELDEIIKTQTNVKSVNIQENMPGVKKRIKGDYGKIGPDFEKQSPKIITHISQQSPKEILKKLKEKGKYEFRLEGEKVELTKEHFIIEREVPKPYTEVKLKQGFVYINSEMDEKLETEGYAREIMRHIQSLRKKAELEKQDDIALFLKADETIVEDLKEWEDQIKKKCGIKNIKISEGKPAKKHKHVDEVKVKDYKFKIAFDKI